MPADPPQNALDALEQRLRPVRVVPYLALALALLLYALSERPSAAQFEITAGIAGLTAAWTTWLIVQQPGRERQPWRARIAVFGMIAFAAALSVRSPWFGLYGYLGFPYAARYLTGAWRWAGFAAAAVVLSISQIGGLHPLTGSRIILWVVVAGLDVALTGTIALQFQRSMERRAAKEISAELAEANQRSEAVMAENAGLQAQLLTQAREAGILEERQRMAREIHDTLAQGLTGIVTQLEAAQRTGDSGEHQRRIDNAKELARASLTEARRSVQALKPGALEGARLPDALAEEAARWSATSGVAADVTTTGAARPLHPEVEVTLLRVAQEALANVAKHAGASRVTVTLSYMEDVVTLDVLDDGGGFDVNQQAARKDGSGFGLTAMRQRVQRLAGELAIESGSGAGTAVSATVPAIPLGGQLWKTER
jgi:signal transduction histidine kinase